jgi:hypothetical protein
MPGVRWSDNAPQVLSALLLELVRHRHLQMLFDGLRGPRSDTPAFMLHPPDLMEAGNMLRQRHAVPARPSGEVVVYPDPPVPAEELAFLRDTFPFLHLHSMSEWTALRAAGGLLDPKERVETTRPTPFLGLSVGLSISESETWNSLGLIADHQDDLAIDVARQLILLGARLLWAGDLRPKGLGVRLEALVRAYHQAARAPQDHIASIPAWPNHQHLSDKDLQPLRAVADVIRLGRPHADQSQPDPPALDAICYSLMRRELARLSDARIILGGRLVGHRGRYPGIAEEAFETVRVGAPLYIVGGFGGAARAVYDAIAATGPEVSLKTIWDERRKDQKVLETNAAYDRLAADLALDLHVDHDEMLKCFKDLGTQKGCPTATSSARQRTSGSPCRKTCTKYWRCS